jgi:hypothetical protein
MIVGVGLQVLGEVRDPVAEQRDLDFRRAGVRVMLAVLLDRLFFPSG